MEVFNKEKNWRDLIKPKALEVEKESLTSTFGKFTARPLELGYGLTLGNSLRRVLLSSLQGAAITNVKIEGALHEFGTLPGVKEEVTEIILNLKKIRFRLSSEESTVRVNITSAGIVTANDIETPHDVDVLNPDQVICHLSDGGKFVAELTVERGRGYVAAEQNKKEDSALGTIAIDSFFSPIQKVNFTVQNSRVGQRTDYDKLILEVWTDGSLRPEDAVALGSKILKDQLTLFLNFQEEAEPTAAKEKEKKESFNPNLYRTVEELELSVRSANCLQNANIKYIYELVQRSEAEMLKTKNFGRKSLNEIKEILTEMGLSLGMKLDGFQAPNQDPRALEGQPEVMAHSHQTNQFSME